MHLDGPNVGIPANLGDNKIVPKVIFLIILSLKGSYTKVTDFGNMQITTNNGYVIT